jgi:hypothetical protein
MGYYPSWQFKNTIQNNILTTLRVYTPSIHIGKWWLCQGRAFPLCPISPVVTPFLLGQPLYNNTEVTSGWNYTGCTAWQLFSGTPLCGEQLFWLYYRCLPHQALQSRKQNGWQHILILENNCLELFLKQSEITGIYQSHKMRDVNSHLYYVQILLNCHIQPLSQSTIFLNALLWNNLVWKSHILLCCMQLTFPHPLQKWKSMTVQQCNWKPNLSHQTSLKSRYNAAQACCI